MKTSFIEKTDRDVIAGVHTLMLAAHDAGDEINAAAFGKILDCLNGNSTVQVNGEDIAHYRNKIEKEKREWNATKSLFQTNRLSTYVRMIMTKLTTAPCSPQMRKTSKSIQYSTSRRIAARRGNR